MKPIFRRISYERRDESILLYLPDGSGHCARAGISSQSDSKCGKEVLLSRVLVPNENGAAILIETVRNPDNPAELRLLSWQDGNERVHQSLELSGKSLLPPAPASNLASIITLADGIAPCGQPAELIHDICQLISKFISLPMDQRLLIASFVLSTWFPDCFEMAPYLWIVGPLGSAKTKLLKLLQCICQRGLLVGDIRSGSLYPLIDRWKPTLLIDELESGPPASSRDFLRILRTGSVPGTPAIRNGQPFDVYGAKIIASRQPLCDAALMSRGVTVSMLPSDAENEPLIEERIQSITHEFQRKLLMYRLTNYFAVKNYSLPPSVLDGMSPRMKQIGRALCAPLLGETKTTLALLAILEDQDEELRHTRSQEPEWLVAEVLFGLCHRKPSPPSFVLVGEIADDVNAEIEKRGDTLKLSARKIGGTLTSLGLRTKRFGSFGRGVDLRHHIRQKIHVLAQKLGINRRDVTNWNAVEAGNGGYACTLCDEIGVTGGLRLRDSKLYSRKLGSSPRTPIFTEQDLQQLD